MNQAWHVHKMVGSGKLRVWCYSSPPLLKDIEQAETTFQLNEALLVLLICARYHRKQSTPTTNYLMLPGYLGTLHNLELSAQPRLRLLNTKLQGGKNVVNVSSAPVSKATPSSPGANDTSKFCNILLIEHRSETYANAFPGH